MSQGNRRFPRKMLPVQFRARDSEGSGNLVFEGADLSAGGTFLKSDLLLEEGEALSVEFRVPGLNRLMRAQGRIAWVRRFPSEAETAGMGVEFLAMSEEDRAAIREYLEALT